MAVNKILRMKFKPAHWFLSASAVPHLGWAHGFGERYDLPVPMTWVIAAACCTVFLSFMLTPFIKSSKNNSPSEGSFNFQLDQPAQISFPKIAAWQIVLKCVSIGLLVLTWIAAMWGSADALMNFSPTFIWIIWWLGTSFACILLGNVWQHIDPWLAVYQIFSNFRTALKTKDQEPTLHSEKIRLTWPRILERWPACAMLLCWCALETIYPIASMPHRLGLWITTYSIVTWAGMWLFGPSKWRQNADGFSLYFELTSQARNILLHKSSVRPSRVAPQTTAKWSTVGVVIAIITSIVFDGLHAGPAWLIFEKWASRFTFIHADLNGYLLGTLGLLILWLLLFGMYVLTCFVMHRLLPTSEHGSQFTNHSTLTVCNDFLAGMMPIAIAYLIAHNFSAFVIQGQNILALISDPMGWGWNIWGTAHDYPDISLIDAKVTWYIATFSIVFGHVVSVVMAHCVATQYCAQLHPPTHIPAWVLNIPMTAVMICFTAISLTLIAEPLVNA